MAPPGMGGRARAHRADRWNGRCGAPVRATRHTARSTLVGVGIKVEKLNAWFGQTQALHDIYMEIQANHATAIIGPSGCGKSTFIRCLNRMHETNPLARVEGNVRIGDLNVYNGTAAVEVRRQIGMVFQKPNPFPTMS